MLVPSPRSKAGWVRLTPACVALCLAHSRCLGLRLTPRGAGGLWGLQRQLWENRIYLPSLEDQVLLPVAWTTWVLRCCLVRKAGCRHVCLW